MCCGVLVCDDVMLPTMIKCDAKHKSASTVEPIEIRILNVALAYYTPQSVCQTCEIMYAQDQSGDSMIQ